MGTGGVTDRPLWLVIAPAEYLDALQPLQQLRRRTLDTDMVAIELVRAESSYLPPEEAIRRYVHQVFEESQRRLQYLFLVGDDTGSADPANIPIGTFTDLGTKTLIAGDAVYGNVNGADILPEVAVGRFPATSIDDVRSYVQRLMAYERAPVDSPTRLGFFAGRGGDLDGWGDLMLAGFLYATADRVFPRDLQLDVTGDGPTKFSDGRTFLQLLNGGGNFVVTYLGHGAASSLHTQTAFDIDTVPQLNIPGRPPIVNLLACGAGCFSRADCLGEALVRAPHGAIAVFGSSVTNEGKMEGETSPVVLRYFGEALAMYLHADAGDRIGDVFLSAVLQSSGSNRHDFLWQILGVLSPHVHDVLALRPNLHEGSMLQAVQLSLLGDPAMRWQPRPLRTDRRAQQVGRLARDARTLLPQPRRPAGERVQIGRPAAAVPGIADTRTVTRDDAEMLVRLADYGIFWLHDMWGRRQADSFEAWLESGGLAADPAGYMSAFVQRVSWRLAAQSFPRFGTVQFIDGRFDIPLESGGLAVGLSDLDDRLAAALAPRSFRGMLDLDRHIRFAVQLTKSGQLRFVDIAGAALEDWYGFRRTVQSVQIDFNYPTPCVTAVVEPEFIDRTPGQCQTWSELMTQQMSTMWNGLVAMVAPQP